MEDSKRRSFALSIVICVLVLGVSAGIAGYRLHRDAARWSPDSAIYLRMTLQDRGLSYSRARDTADRFMLKSSEANYPSSRGFYGSSPPKFYRTEFKLFASRPLYPFLGAAFYPRLGPHGLQVISAIAYVLACGTMFVLLLLVAPSWLAGLGALAFAMAPQVLDITAAPLTDGLSLFFWIVILAAMFYALQKPGVTAVVVAGLATFGLTFTHPAVFFPFIAAIGMFFAAWDDVRIRTTALQMLALTVVAGIAFAVYTVAIHGPGVVEQFHWLYEWRRAIGDPAAAHGPFRWYVHSLAAVIAVGLTFEIYVHGALITLVLAAFGVAATRGRRILPVVIAVACACLVALILTPFDFGRTADVWFIPAIILLATAALAARVPNNEFNRLTPRRE